MKEKAVLIDIIDPKTTPAESDLRLEELENLVKTYGSISKLQLIQKRATPAYKTYVGEGKVTELLDRLESFDDLDVIIVNNIMKPRQIYNLEELCINYQIKKRDEELARIEELYEKKGRKSDIRKHKLRFQNPKKIQVWDRVDLILKIFDKHAKTAEAKLQIELASIKHMGPRIFGMGLELSRQAGGIGTVGAGESNIEMMKRHLQKRLKVVESKIKDHSKVQARHREARRNRNLRTVSLVGYTNAGKSTLIRALTKKEVYIADELFATLDSRAGELFLPKSRTKAILTDTIGFIQDLPPDLIDAFKSTLAEILEADLLLHVIDINDPNIETKIQVVEEILDSLGVDTKNKVYVFNKIDTLEARVENDEITEEDKLDHIAFLTEKYAEYNPQLVSAVKRKELDHLKDVIEEYTSPSVNA